MPFLLLRAVAGTEGIVINYDKLNEITRGLDENPALFFFLLTKALQKFTTLDSTSPEGALLLNTHFISQSAPNISRKL
jgi:hypothetical protein